MRGIIREDVLERRDKIGFATPQEKWVKKSWLQNQTVFRETNTLDFLDMDLFIKYLSEGKNDSSRSMDLKWRVFNLLKWQQIMGVSN